ncbi:MFS transporter [Burkholderia gladioli]|uniref:MFS transporter n=1 Tax=Burkholderia gladioli TaxID=28095 RepID=UPI000F54C24E|nr:MFS transporter [Burkholderia gladioli]
MTRKLVVDAEPPPSAVSTERDANDALYLKLALRLVPLLIVCYVVAYLDRINVGFAKLQMQEALGFSDAVYGLGAGIFFIGYFLFEVPSNLLLQRIGARKTITRIMVMWGVTGCLMATVSNPATFYILRFLLGVFEAGFFPGVIYYLAQWFPRGRRGQILGMFMTGFPIAGMIGGPLSGWAMSRLEGAAGLAGWQWLYIVEAAPAVLLGMVAWFGLSDSLERAHWLSETERDTLRRALSEDGAGEAHRHGGEFRRVIADPKVYLISFAYFTFICGTYALSFWSPTVLKNVGVTSLEHIGWLSAIPYGAAAIGMVLICRHSDRVLERRWHGALSALVGALALCLLPVLAHELAATLVLLSIASIAVFVTIPLLWAQASDYFAGSPAAAPAIALVNSLGLLGGFASPFAMGWLKALTGTLTSGLYLMTALLALGACVLLRVRSGHRGA